MDKRRKAISDLVRPAFFRVGYYARLGFEFAKGYDVKQDEAINELVEIIIKEEYTCLGKLERTFRFFADDQEFTFKSNLIEVAGRYEKKVLQDHAPKRAKAC